VDPQGHCRVGGLDGVHHVGVGVLIGVVGGSGLGGDGFPPLLGASRPIPPLAHWSWSIFSPAAALAAGVPAAARVVADGAAAALEWVLLIVSHGVIVEAVVTVAAEDEFQDQADDW
jgi:hypothetical protein